MNDIKAKGKSTKSAIKMFIPQQAMDELIFSQRLVLGFLGGVGSGEVESVSKFVSITFNDLTESLNITARSMFRILKQLKAKQWIEYEHCQIVTGDKSRKGIVIHLLWRKGELPRGGKGKGSRTREPIIT